MKNALKQFKTIDEWRNCPMANFVCPVAIETRLETNTPRGKMFLLSLLCNGVMNIDEDIVQRMYECCLCGLCTQCGFDDTDIPAAMAAARADICEAGCMPEKVRELGKAIEDGCVWNRYQDVEKLITKEAVAFITWEDENAAAFEKLAKKAGFTPLVIKEGEYDSALLYELGLWDASEKCIEKITKLAANAKIQRVVVDSPHLWDLLKKKANSDKITPLTSYLKELVDSGKLRLRKTKDVVTYHDPCRLVRREDDETTVRGLLAAAGIGVAEMRWNKRDAKCCGGPALKIMAPKISENITKRRIREAEDTKAEKLLTACGHCLANFKENGFDKKTVSLLELIVSLAE
jgi:Fe-S oxidoreductase